MSGAYLFIRKGDDYTFSTNVSVDNVATNLYGSDLWFQAWQLPTANVNDPQLLINASTDSGQIVVSGNNNNTVTVTLNGADTANYVEANVMQWQLRVETSANKVYTLDRGLACIANSLISQPWS